MTSGLRYVCLSDLHLGAPDSTLTIVRYGVPTSLLPR